MIGEIEKNRTKNDPNQIKSVTNYTYTGDNIKDMLVDVDYGTAGHVSLNVEQATAKYTYTYDNKGFPTEIIAEMFVNNLTNPITNKIYYEYK